MLGLQNYSVQIVKLYYIWNSRLNLYREVDRAHANPMPKEITPGFLLQDAELHRGTGKSSREASQAEISAKGGEYKVPHKPMAYTISALG